MGYYCGWDGGGSKTEVLCADASGREIARRRFGPLNVNGAAEAQVAQTIADAVRFMQTVGGLSNCLGLAIGAAGVSNARMSEFIAEQVRSAGYAGKLTIVGDHEIALEGAVHGPGAVLIAGTGSICIGRDGDGNRARAGGFGYLIDDVGSGYAIGREILTAVVRAHDGRGGETSLTGAVLDRLNVRDVSGMLTWLYGPQTGKKEIAALAPLLILALSDGDEAAEEIARSAAEELAGLALAVWRKLGLQRGELALTGSVLEHYECIRDEVARICCEQFSEMNVIKPRGTACEGAVRLAMKL